MANCASTGKAMYENFITEIFQPDSNVELLPRWRKQMLKNKPRKAANKTRTVKVHNMIVEINLIISLPDVHHV